MSEALEKARALRHRRCEAALSPHAPYSTVPELLRLSARAAASQGRLLCTHVSESELEFDMFVHARGEMFDWLKKSGRDMADCGLGSPIQHLDRCGLLSPNLLAAHVNQLARGDASLLAKRGVSVVHCPRSHSYFRHPPFPLRQLRRAGVNICLGTDSLASVYKTRRQTVELSLFDEMRALKEREPAWPARSILEMGTVNAARALGRGEDLGRIAPGAMADLIALPLTGKGRRIYDAVLEEARTVSASLIGGRWAIGPS